MMFLVRTAFWLSLVALFMPVGRDGPADAAVASPVAATLADHSTAITDVPGFCGEYALVCQTTGMAVRAMGATAEIGVHLLSTLLADEAGAPAARGGDTLTPGDREPAWLAPGVLPAA